MSGNGDAAAPRVTVVTPAYNVAQYIGEAVDSVLAQTFTDFEYLVVDDGSQDDSVEVVRAHAGHDPRFRLVAGEHRGLSAVRNIGIKEARGQYIAYLDGDDRWHPQFLERQVALIESLPPDVGLVFCRPRLILENGTVVFYQWQRAGRYDFDDFLVGANPARCGSSLLIRKSCFDDVGQFDEDLASVEDLEMWLRIAAGSKTPVLWGSKHFLVDLRLRPGSVTRDRAASAGGYRPAWPTCGRPSRPTSTATAMIWPTSSRPRPGRPAPASWFAACRDSGCCSGTLCPRRAARPSGRHRTRRGSWSSRPTCEFVGASARSAGPETEETADGAADQDRRAGAQRSHHGHRAVTGAGRSGLHRGPDAGAHVPRPGGARVPHPGPARRGDRPGRDLAAARRGGQPAPGGGGPGRSGRPATRRPAGRRRPGRAGRHSAGQRGPVYPGPARRSGDHRPHDLGHGVPAAGTGRGGQRADLRRDQGSRAG